MVVVIVNSKAVCFRKENVRNIVYCVVAFMSYSPGNTFPSPLFPPCEKHWVCYDSEICYSH